MDPLEKPPLNVKVQVFTDGKPAFRALVRVDNKDSQAYWTNQDGFVMVHVPVGEHIISTDMYDQYPPSLVKVTIPGPSEVKINIPSSIVE